MSIFNDFSDIPDDWELPSGSVKRGRRYFKKHCAMCHSIQPDNRLMWGQRGFPLGPSLYMICNRTANFRDKQEFPIVWTDAALMHYMKNPRLSMDGINVQMNFAGIPEMQPRVDIIHFLHTLEPENLKSFNRPPPLEGFWIAHLWRALKRWYTTPADAASAKLNGPKPRKQDVPSGFEFSDPWDRN